MNKSKIIKIISGALLTGIAAYGVTKNKGLICEKLHIETPEIKEKKKKELEEKITLKLKTEKENSEKICKLFGSKNTDIESLVDEIYKKGFHYPGYQVKEPKQYRSSINLINAILYYFVEFGDPEKYSFTTFDEMARKTKHVISPEWNIYNPELDRIKEEYPNSKCAYYYKEFKSHYMAFSAFSDVRNIFDNFDRGVWTL